MKKIISVVMFIGLCLLMSCGDNSSNNQSEEKAAKYRKADENANLVSDYIAKSNSDFAVKLLNEISKSVEADTNIMISPLSVSLAMTMAANGAIGTKSSSINNFTFLSSS